MGLPSTSDMTLQKPIHDVNAIPLMLMSDNGSVYLFTEDEKPIPSAGQKLVCMISPIS
jgi:hypothetical protein